MIKSHLNSSMSVSPLLKTTTTTKFRLLHKVHTLNSRSSDESFAASSHTSSKRSACVRCGGVEDVTVTLLDVVQHEPLLRRARAPALSTSSSSSKVRNVCAHRQGKESKR